MIKLRRNGMRARSITVLVSLLFALVWAGSAPAAAAPHQVDAAALAEQARIVAANDVRLGGMEITYTGPNAQARSYQDCSSLFPGYLCFWDGAFASGRMRVFNNSIIGTDGINFVGTSWDNVTKNAWNQASSTTYRVWTLAPCLSTQGHNGPLSPGAMGGWTSGSVFYNSISGVTIAPYSGC